MRLTLLSLVVLPLLTSLPAQARPTWMTGTYVYADLCTDLESGGMAGRRVVVRRSPNGNDVTYQAALGSLGAPLPADGLSIDDERQEITFTIQGDHGPVRFQGTAGATMLAGTFSDSEGDHPVRLRRTLRSRGHEDCRLLQQDPETTGSTN